MPLTYSKNKVHIYKWVENNREKHNATVLKYKRRRKLFEEETKIFRNILIDNFI